MTGHVIESGFVDLRELSIVLSFEQMGYDLNVVSLEGPGVTEQRHFLTINTDHSS